MTELKTLITANMEKVLPIELARAVIGAPPAATKQVEFTVMMHICAFLDDLGPEALDADGEPLYAMDEIQAMARMVILAANIAALEMLMTAGDDEDPIGPTVGTA